MKDLRAEKLLARFRERATPEELALAERLCLSPLALEAKNAVNAWLFAVARREGRGGR